MGRTSTARKSRPRDAATKIAEQRLSVLELARELGNVAEACPRRGMVYSVKRCDSLEGTA